ncbi:MAG: helix-turn-helix transcriptional regulator [Coriobacteriales bacterium]|jgi:DNA-binding XRE family transcriptional regulator|nr:helix-turn-helix transcriptional regulator [Coriobacteriales bacterium]
MSKIDELIEKRSKDNPKFAEGYKRECERLEVAVALMQLREEEGLTQRQLAELSGKPQSTIARIENGSMNTSMKVLNEIATSLGKKVELRFVRA